MIDSRRIRGLRPAKPWVDPFVAHGTVLEVERRRGGVEESALTVFLAGAECSFTCSFCDLWRWTIDGPTPPGALVAQLSAALAGTTMGARPHRLKLYNASNFFDRRAVPPSDLPAIAELAAPFDAVTVESHVNTIGPAAASFANLLPGRLEVAVGLETVHPVAATHLNKRLDLDRFSRAADFLASHNIDLRVFVLLGAPHIPVAETIEWTVRTVEHAVSCGSAMVCIIPVRGGNGEMERLAALGEWAAPTLAQLETALERCLTHASVVVTADMWDVERLAACGDCRDARVDRIRRMNASGRVEARVQCAECAS